MTFDPNTTQRIAAAVKSKIIPDWRSRLRDYSTWALGLVTVLSSSVLAAWTFMPAEWKAGIPQDVVLWIGGGYLALGAFGGIGKFVVQGPTKE